MGVCQSCRLLPAGVKSCATNCSENSCNGVIICDDRDSVNQMVGVHALTTMSDRSPGSDPVGAIFEETLELVQPLDREFLLFCATSNVLAVRWLLHLGAHWDARDTNNSTSMHVACRAGSLQVISELLSYRGLLEATDLAKWSPLHIAAFMGRREVVVRLLHAGASPSVQNMNRQTAVDLSPDFGTLAAFKEGTGEQLDADDEDMQDDAYRYAHRYEDNVSGPLECEHIPFFLPPVPAIRSHDRREELWSIAVLIFNKQPSFGLAFIVCTGLANNYADALVKILQRSNVNRSHVGGFLGEALSLSSLTRLSLFDSIPLYSTGVVSSLRVVFSVFQLPQDFQKINRLLNGLAHVWWRKHKEQSTGGLVVQTTRGGVTGMIETSGAELKACMSSLDSLAQLMFSTVLLHWYMHGDGGRSTKQMKLSVWMMLNRGLGVGGTDIPELVQRRIHDMISSGFIKELALAAPDASPLDSEREQPGMEMPNHSVLHPTRSALATCAVLEGWVQHHPIGAHHMGSGMPSSRSEVPFSLSASGAGVHYDPGGSSPLDNVMSAVITSESLFMRPQKDAKMWLSLCGSLLFFWEGGARLGSNNATPHMFLDLQKTQVMHHHHHHLPQNSPREDTVPAEKKVVDDSRVITLVGMSMAAVMAERARGMTGETDATQMEREGTKLSLEATTASRESTGGFLAKHFAPSGSEVPVAVVHLLPDGRWQELHLTRLELQFPNNHDAEVWATHLTGCVVTKAQLQAEKERLQTNKIYNKLNKTESEATAVETATPVGPRPEKISSLPKDRLASSPRAKPSPSPKTMPVDPGVASLDAHRVVLSTPPQTPILDRMPIEEVARSADECFESEFPPELPQEIQRPQLAMPMPRTMSANSEDSGHTELSV